MIDQATDVVAHGPRKVESVHVRVLDVREIPELLPEGALSTESWRQDIRISQRKPAEKGSRGIISALIHILNRLASSAIPLLQIIFLFANFIEPSIESVFESSLE